MVPTHLLSTLGCERTSYCDAYCPEAVKEGPNGRWFITMGHPGFNSRANNFDGYFSRATALAAVHHYSRPRR